MERTLILFKPDAVQRRLCGELLSRFERKGLRIVGLKMMQLTREQSRRHYAEHVSKPFYPNLESFITSGPVVALVAEGPQAVKAVRSMMGSTNGVEAAPGTIRGDHGLSRQLNLVHGSDSIAAAAREIEIYFQPHELLEYDVTLSPTVAASDE